jgi:hypothetical protein
MPSSRLNGVSLRDHPASAGKMREDSVTVVILLRRASLISRRATSVVTPSRTCFGLASRPPKERCNTVDQSPAAQAASHSTPDRRNETE